MFPNTRIVHIKEKTKHDNPSSLRFPDMLTETYIYTIDARLPGGTAISIYKY
jgi:hypothetical protein